MEKKKPSVSSQDEEQRRQSDLDETMEEIFHPSSDRFSLADLQSRDNLDIRPKCDERDFARHRRESFHHHQPLHRLHHRHRRSSHKTSEPPAADSNKVIEVQSEPEPSTSGVADDMKSKGVQTTDEAMVESEPETSEASQAPLLSKTKETGKETKKADEDSKVQFYVGSASSIEDAPSSSGSIAERLTSFFKSSKLPLKSALKQPEMSKTSPKKGLSQSATQPSTSGVAPNKETLETSFTDSVLGKPSTMPTFPTIPEAIQGKPKVTFQLGEEVTEEEMEVPPMSRKHSHSAKHGKKHHKSHDTLADRMHVGSDLDYKAYPDALEPEEAETLQTADIEDMASHRFEDPKAIRRHKIRSKSLVDSFKQIGKDEGTDKQGSPFAKKIFDHQPHEIFVELHELFPEAPPLLEEYRISVETSDISLGGEFLWRQTARWIKYEEDVEERADRWGKPHVASLSFHSLISLRKCLETGVVLLDIEETEFPGIANHIVDGMLTADLIKSQHKAAVLKALLSRKRHVNEKISAPFLRRNSSGYGNLNMLSHERTKSPRFVRMMRNITDHDFYHNFSSQDRTAPNAETNVLMPEADGMKDVTIVPNSRRSSSLLDEYAKYDTGIMKRVPINSEATAVLVGSLLFLEQPAVAFVRLSQGHIVPNLLEIPIPVRFLFVLLGPLNSDLDYHEIGRSISTLMSNKHFHQAAYKADGRKDLLRAINEFLDDSVVLPPGHWEKKSFVPMDEIKRRSIQFRKRETLVVPEEEEELDAVQGQKFDPLKRTGRWFGGFVNDIKNRYPWYKSDLLDGLDRKCISASLSIYFAALSGAVTFGGLLADKTNQLVGVTETLFVTSVCGVVFSLFACQPLIIVGTTGPMLLFDEILYQFCESNRVNFLRLRVWTSFWTAAISTVVVAFEGSSLLCYITRFMQEIYATIISLLFIAESFANLYKIFLENPVQEITCDNEYENSTISVSSTPSSKIVNKPNTALLSMILMFGTFLLALFLRHVRHSKFFGRTIAKQLGDFGVPIALLVMVLSDYSFKDVYTQTLIVPEGLQPSDPDQRGWFISPLPISVKEALGTVVTGFLIFILMFLETQICELILSKKERKMKKGSGFHFDMMLISYMEVACALLGGPWLCATTVRSLAHVAGLTEMSTTHAPGESPYIVEVKEQRISNLVISLGVGLSILLAPYLSLIPVAVLFGVFLYMGITSLSGIQLCERILLLFMPVKHHPDVPYVRKTLLRSDLQFWKVICKKWRSETSRIKVDTELLREDHIVSLCFFSSHVFYFLWVSSSALVFNEVLTKKMHLFTIIQVLCIGVLWGIKSSILAPGFPFGLLSLIFVRSQLKCCFTDFELQALDGGDDEEKKDDEPEYNEQMVA